MCQQLTLDTPIFSEPSQNAAYRDGTTFPAGQPTANVLDPRNPITFDLTRDQPDNVIHACQTAAIRARLGSFTQRDSTGRTIVELYGDLKRHVMGPRLAEPVNEIAGDDVTPIPIEPAQSPHTRHVPHREPVGCRVHGAVHARRPRDDAGRGDPRARGVEQRQRQRGARRRAPRISRARSPTNRRVIAFLENLVLFKVEEEEEAAAAAASSGAADADRAPRRSHASRSGRRDSGFGSSRGSEGRGRGLGAGVQEKDYSVSCSPPSSCEISWSSASTSVPDRSPG